MIYFKYIYIYIYVNESSLPEIHYLSAAGIEIDKYKCILKLDKQNTSKIEILVFGYHHLKITSTNHSW